MNTVLAKFGLFVAVLCTVGFIDSTQAFGQATGVSKSSTSSTSSPWSANWKTNFSGPTFSEIDGFEGEGSALYLKNQWQLRYKFAKDWTAELTPSVEYKSGTPKKASSFGFADPYLGAKRKNVVDWKAARFKMHAEARYYFPLSTSTRNAVGTKKDKGNGRGYLRLQTYKYFGESNFNYFGEYVVKRDFAKDPDEEGSLNHYELLNYVQFKASKTFKPFVTYQNFITTYRDGSADAWVKNHEVGVGAEIKPVKDLVLEPSFNSKFMLKDTEFRLEAVYRFI